jgi:hypothetical protein
MRRFLSALSCGALISIVVLFGLGFSALASDNTIVPSIGITEQYNDNILFQRVDEEDDFITTVHPKLDFQHESEIIKMETVLESYLNYYIKETDLNDQHYRGMIDLDSSFLERWRFKANGEFVRDTTLESQLMETGRVYDRDDRNQFEGDLRGIFKVTELSSVSLRYRYRQVEYESDTNVDFNVDTVNLSILRKLKNQVDTINLYGGYSYNESREREIDTYNIGLGWSRELTDVYRIRMSGGYRTSKTLNIDREEESSDGFTVDINLFRRGEIYEALIGYRRGLTNAASGEYLEFDRFYGHFQRHLSERSTVRVDGLVVFSRDDSDITAENSRFFQIAPRLSYRVTENSVLSFGYRYSHDYDDEQEDEKSADRNVVFIDFRVDFPKKL